MRLLDICKTSTGDSSHWVRGAACMQDYKEQSASFGVWPLGLGKHIDIQQLSELNIKNVDFRTQMDTKSKTLWVFLLRQSRVLC